MEVAPSIVISVRVPISPTIVVATRTVMKIGTEVVSVPVLALAPLMVTPFTVVIPCQSYAWAQYPRPQQCSENYRWQSKSLEHNCLLTLFLFGRSRAPEV